jgi:glycerol-1-phosphate dehydrogenase [NAD(P)+]
VTTDYLGIIRELVAGTWREPSTGRTYGIPIESIAIDASLDGKELGLVEAVHFGKRLVVVSDAFTREALGARVFRALEKRGNVREHVWERPRCTPEGIDELMAACPDAEAFVAVGSGTISDSVKYGSYATGREYSVFATSPMNAYTTPTASISYDGFKKSVTCHSAKGVFFDLSVLAKCPRRLVAAAFADVICRTTAQVDWLMSHLLFGTPYSDTAYALLAADEDEMIASAQGLVEGDFDALATLTRVAAIMGLGTSFTGTTHVGSMAEHMISHYIDMFAGDDHPRTSHGEQVGVATLTMSELQNQILNDTEPPRMRPTAIPEATLRQKFGEATADTMIEQTAKKALDEEKAAALNARFEREWDGIREKLQAVMRPTEQIRDAMRTAGCQLTGRELGLKPEFYRDAVRCSRFIRDRWTMLDVAGDSGQLERFAARCE